MRPAAAALAFLIISIGPSLAQQAPDWKHYQDANYQFGVDIPYGLFMPSSDAGPKSGLSFSEVDGGGEIHVYGGNNTMGADPAKLANILSAADQVRTVTYKAGGGNWLVLSGYYKGDAGKPGGDLIFYTKLMFNPSRTALSAFEISYPKAEKSRMDPIVSRIETSLTPPK